MYAQGISAIGSPTIVATLPNPTTSGNTIIVAVGFYTGGGSPVNPRYVASITDNKGNPAPSADPNADPYTPVANSRCIYVYTYDNIIGGSGHAITVTLSDAYSSGTILVNEFGGRATVSKDTSNVSYTSGGIQSHLGTDINVNQNGDDILSIINNGQVGYNPETFTPGSGYTPGAQQTSNAYPIMYSQYKNNQVIGTYTTPFITPHYDTVIGFSISLLQKQTKSFSWINIT